MVDYEAEITGEDDSSCGEWSYDSDDESSCCMEEYLADCDLLQKLQQRNQFVPPPQSDKCVDVAEDKCENALDDKTLSMMLSSVRVQSLPRVHSSAVFPSHFTTVRGSDNNPIVVDMTQLHKSASVPMLAKDMPAVEEDEDTPSNNRASESPDYDDTNPENLIRSIMEEKGFPSDTFPAMSVEDFFLLPTEQNIRAYTEDVIAAVRGRDIDTLRQMKHEGRELWCCNKFGESILHMACRKGHIDVIRFLIHEAGLSLCVRDDYGRTPMHDACWTGKPLFGLLLLLIELEPDLLHISDVRGFTPMNYVRRENWADWCRFLDDHKDIIMSKKLFSNRNGLNHAA